MWWFQTFQTTTCHFSQPRGHRGSAGQLSFVAPEQGSSREGLQGPRPLRGDAVAAGAGAPARASLYPWGFQGLQEVALGEGS